MTTASQFKKEYVQWLEREIVVSQVGDALSIVTPFLDHNNDYIEIFLIPQGDRYLLTDDGNTVGELELVGVDLSAPKRKNVFETIVNGFGVQTDGDALWVMCTLENFALKKHMLIQSILAVSDMFMMSSHRVRGVFFEDVESYFEMHDIRYTQSISLNGTSGLVHTFDFVIPGSKKSNERLLKLINTPSKDKSQSVIFSWNDIRNMRKFKNKSSEMYVFINDRERPVNPEFLNAFESYDIKPLLWNNRDSYVEILSS